MVVYKIAEVLVYKIKLSSLISTKNINPDKIERLMEEIEF